MMMTAVVAMTIKMDIVTAKNYDLGGYDGGYWMEKYGNDGGNGVITTIVVVRLWWLDAHHCSE